MIITTYFGYSEIFWNVWHYIKENRTFDNIFWKSLIAYREKYKQCSILDSGNIQKMFILLSKSEKILKAWSISLQNFNRIYAIKKSVIFLIKPSNFMQLNCWWNSSPFGYNKRKTLKNEFFINRVQLEYYLSLLSGHEQQINKFTFSI